MYIWLKKSRIILMIFPHLGDRRNSNRKYYGLQSCIYWFLRYSELLGGYMIMAFGSEGGQIIGLRGTCFLGSAKTRSLSVEGPSGSFKLLPAKVLPLSEFEGIIGFFCLIPGAQVGGYVRNRSGGMPSWRQKSSPRATPKPRYPTPRK